MTRIQKTGIIVFFMTVFESRQSMAGNYLPFGKSQVCIQLYVNQ